MAKLNLTKGDIMRAADIGVMGLLGLLVLLMVVRPLVRRIITPEEAAKTGRASVAGALGVSDDTKSGPSVAVVKSEERVAISNRTSEMIDIAQVHGQVHAKSVQKVGELADQNPHETVAIIRSWLHEDAA
jgi:flagellar M-ring protein FliF